LRGTPSKIRPEGSLAVRDAGMRIPNREERVSEVNGFLILDSTGVTVESLEGKIGKDGEVKLTGTFASLEDFEFDAEVRDATIFETGLYRFRVNGEFRAFPAESDGKLAPQVVGTVNVEEGAIIGDLAKAPRPAGPAGKPRSPWRAEIDIFAPGNIRMQTAVASVDLGQAENLHVSYVDPDLNVTGGLTVLGGRYRVFNNVFQITSGTVEFRDTGRQVEPILDVYAESMITDYTDPQDPTQVTIQIHAYGPVTDLRLDFSSTPDRATDEIVALLSIKRWLDPETGRGELLDPGEAYVMTEAISQIEAEIGQRFSALQNLSVRPGEPGQEWELNVRQTILPQVSVAYTRELSSTADQEVSVHYNLRGKLYLNAGVQRRQLQIGPPVDRYLLDLKLRFEYK
jgi:autotransporter translocation and assembly factor TamB